MDRSPLGKRRRLSNGKDAVRPGLKRRMMEVDSVTGAQSAVRPIACSFLIPSNGIIQQHELPNGTQKGPLKSAATRKVDHKSRINVDAPTKVLLSKLERERSFLMLFSSPHPF